ncbi:MAG: RNA polymerase sigma factor [Solirubrobacteraceae bacterium]
MAELMDLARATDDELLGAIASRDPGAFRVFYRRHLPVTLAYLMRETRDPELAADLAAEVFAAVLLSAHRYLDHGVTAAPWVVGIARNKLLMSLRSGGVDVTARERLGFEPVALKDADLERVAAVAHDGAAPLRTLVDELPDEERRAVFGRVVYEGDIAGELRCSEMLVRMRVSRGMSRIRRRLGGS